LSTHGPPIQPMLTWPASGALPLLLLLEDAAADEDDAAAMADDEEETAAADEDDTTAAAEELCAAEEDDDDCAALLELLPLETAPAEDEDACDDADAAADAELPTLLACEDAADDDEPAAELLPPVTATSHRLPRHTSLAGHCSSVVQVATHWPRTQCALEEQVVLPQVSCCCGLFLVHEAIMASHATHSARRMKGTLEDAAACVTVFTPEGRADNRLPDSGRPAT